MTRENLIYTTEEGFETSHSLIRHEDPLGLVIMLPGGNNISDRPIMHFTRKGLLDMGYDILNIDYNGFLDKCDDFEAFVTRLTSFVDNVLEANLHKFKYKRMHMFGRSTGSIIAARIISSNKYSFENIVFISPTGKTFKTISNHLKCRIYFDPHDIHLKSMSYDNIIRMTNVDRREYLGANHNFEFDNDLQKTMRVTGEVVNDMIEYLTK